MAFSLAPLLVHSESIPLVVREALRAATAAPAEHRRSALASAARVLYMETPVNCDDALEIVGLQSDCGCD